VDFHKIRIFLQESVDFSLKMTGVIALIRIAFYQDGFDWLWKWSLCFFVLGLIICVISDAYGSREKPTS